MRADTDSLILDIQTEDVYKDMQEHSWLYDTSNYPKDHLLYNDINKKVLGKMKNECGGEALSCSSKAEDVLGRFGGQKNIRKAKGVKKL